MEKLKHNLALPGSPNGGHSQAEALPSQQKALEILTRPEVLQELHVGPLSDHCDHLLQKFALRQLFHCLCISKHGLCA